MSGFLEKILSGKYPELETLWRTEFGKIINEVFGPSPEKREGSPADYLADDFDDDDFGSEVVGLQADVNRLEALVVELRQKLDSAVSELQVSKSERRALEYKLDKVRDAVRSNFHQEPWG